MADLKIISEDPLRVLESTRSVLESSHFVSINPEKVSDMARTIQEKFPNGVSMEEIGFKSIGNLEDDIQRTFIENTVNFCFWAGKGEKKWEVEWPSGNIISGGWFAFTACFDRALAKNTRILNSDYLASISAADVEKLFYGVDGIKIPLLEERSRNLREAGQVLMEKFKGKFMNAIEEAHFDAIKIVKLLIEHFSSFRDISILEGKKVFLLKRAQLCPNDFNYFFEKSGKRIENLGVLTAFADYKIPQILRAMGVLEYNRELSDKVDNYIEIPHDSREEIEIRSATIWGTELLKQTMPNFSARQVDNTIWLISQNQEGLKPYHRTRTIFY